MFRLTNGWPAGLASATDLEFENMLNGDTGGFWYTWSPSLREAIEERLPRAREEADASHRIAMNSYGAGYDCGYRDALEELLKIANDEQA